MAQKLRKHGKKLEKTSVGCDIDFTILLSMLRPDFFYFLVLGRFLTKVWIGGENKNKNIS